MCSMWLLHHSWSHIWSPCSGSCIFSDRLWKYCTIQILVCTYPYTFCRLRNGLLKVVCMNVTQKLNTLESNTFWKVSIIFIVFSVCWLKCTPSRHRTCFAAWCSWRELLFIEEFWTARLSGLTYMCWCVLSVYAGRCPAGRYWYVESTPACFYLSL